MVDEEFHGLRGLGGSKMVSAVYSWGRNDKHQLGLKDPKANLNSPKVLKNKVLAGSVITGISCGPTHTLLVTADGNVYGSGDNTEGQLSPSDGQDAFIAKPGMLSVKGVQAACGLAHSACLSPEGRVLTFGTNQFSQLGHSHDRSPSRVMPRIVEGLSRQIIVQVACNEDSTIMLDKYGKVYTCGSAKRGVLGLDTMKNQSEAHVVGGALEGVPVCNIAAGARHCIVCSVNGDVFGWGDNNAGQLGVTKNVTGEEGFSKTPLRSLCDVQVRSAACGEEHSVFVALNGQVFTCGSNAQGQLGQDKSQDYDTPTKVASLSRVVQASCGNSHSCVLTDNGAVYTFGSGTNGQLGNATFEKAVATPTAVPNVKDVTEVIAGGESTFALSLSTPKLDINKVRVHTMKAPYAEASLGISVSKLSEFCKVYETLTEKQREKSLLRLFSTMLNLQSLNASFLDERAHVPLTVIHKGAKLFDQDARIGDRTKSMLDVEGMIRTARTLVASVLDKSAEKMQKHFRIRIASLVANMDRVAPGVTDAVQARAYFILLVSPWMALAPREHEAVVMAIFRLPAATREIIFNWVKTENPEAFFVEYLLKPLLSYLDKHLRFLKWTGQAVKICDVLNSLHEMQPEAMPSLSPDMFYTNVPTEWREAVLVQLYERWKYNVRGIGDVDSIPEFTLFRFPFLLSAATKRRMLHVEDKKKQQHFAAHAMISHNNPFLILEVDRDHLLNETIMRIEHVEREEENFLRRPLRVKFKGEEGLDAGGVKKEFFQLLGSQLFSADFGMFREIEVGGGSQLWFNRSGIHNDPRTFELVGILMGLAIYNDTLLDLQFPRTLYEMLLGRFPQEPGLKEMEGFDKDMAQQLKSILEIKDEAELESLFLTFETTEKIFEEMVSVPLKPGGEEIPVTLANRDEYVKLLIEYTILGPKDQQYHQSLVDGFHKLIPLDMVILSLFEPPELELVLVGTPNLNFVALEKRSTYEGGYNEKAKSVKRFWKIIHDLPFDKQQLFLKFVTGSPRAPVGGLEVCNFKVQRAGPDSNQLPTAHTCFNTLMLPDYSSEAKMKKLLLLAIENCEGFGLE